MRNNTPSGRANSPFGVGLEKLGGVIITGTTDATANTRLINPPRSPFKRLPILVESDSEGFYTEDRDNLTEGFFFPNAETTIEATTSSNGKVVVLSDTIAVSVYLDGTALDSRAHIRNTNDNSLTQGTEVAVDTAGTDFDVCKLSSTQFAVSFIDTGADSYLAVRVGTVTSAGAITFGTKKVMNAAALKSGAGTCICLANTLTLFVGYVLNADGKGYGIASTFSATTGTVATPGSAVEFDGGADTKELSCCSHTTGDVAVVYQAGGDANDPITMCCGTVTTGKVISFGDEVSMAGAAAAATGIDCCAMGTDIVAFCWVDSTYLHVNCATIAVKVPTKKTETQTTIVALTPTIVSLGGEKVAVAYEADADNDFGKITTFTFSRSDYTFTEIYTSNFANAAVVTPSIDAFDANNVIVTFEDDADSDKTKVIAGKWSKYLIDVRSSAASKAFRMLISGIPGRRQF